MEARAEAPPRLLQPACGTPRLRARRLQAAAAVRIIFYFFKKRGGSPRRCRLIGMTLLARLTAVSYNDTRHRVVKSPARLLLPPSLPPLAPSPYTHTPCATAYARIRFSVFSGTAELGMATALQWCESIGCARAGINGTVVTRGCSWKSVKNGVATCMTGGTHGGGKPSGGPTGDYQWRCYRKDSLVNGSWAPNVGPATRSSYCSKSGALAGILRTCNVSLGTGDCPYPDKRDCPPYTDSCYPKA